MRFSGGVLDIVGRSVTRNAFLKIEDFSIVCA
jgi:hypothetical protein